MKIKQKIAALGVGVALLGGGSAIAMATSGASSAATNPPAAAPDQAGRQKPGALMRRVVHGDLTVRTKDGFEKVVYDRGTVTAKDANSITIKRPDNVTVTVKVNDTTKYRGVSSLDQVQVDKPAIVLAKDGTAVMVGQRTGAGNQRPARPGATPAGMADDPLV